MKQIISIIILLAVIITLDVITITNTRETMELLSNNINDIKNNVETQDTKNIQSSIDELDKNWKKSIDKLSYYIEHNELDKVEVEIVTFKTDIKNQEYDEAIESMERANFLLEHIKDKNQFNLKNIF